MITFASVMVLCRVVVVAMVNLEVFLLVPFILWVGNTSTES